MNLKFILAYVLVLTLRCNSEYLTGFIFKVYLSLTPFTCKHIALEVKLVAKLYQNIKFWNYENSDSLTANKTKPGTKTHLAQI